MNRNASAVWNGNPHDGAGTLTTESGVLSGTPYAFPTPFPEGIGTNPYELIAASLGSCFAVTLARELVLAGLSPERISATATATLNEPSDGSMISHIQLDVQAKVPGSTQDQFIVAALAAKTTCPIARVLNTTISLAASLDGEPDRDGENLAIPLVGETAGL
jgi:osmotically inducible protein OsmC